MLANVFIDTNIWIYLFLTSPERGDLAKREAAKRLLHDHARIIISNQVLNEMANVLLKKYHLPQRRVEQYVQELLKITDVVLLNHTHTLEAIRLTETSRLSFYDALIVAAAKDAQCQQLFSEDLQHGQVIDKTVTIINPFSAISP